MTKITDTENASAPDSHSFDRRAFLGGAFKTIGLVGAGTLFEQQALASALSFTPDKETTNKAGTLFNAKQMAMLKQLTDLVLPKTDTPGGVELGVHQFLDHQLYSCYEETDQNKLRALLLRLDQQSDQTFDKTFLQLSVDQQIQLLQKLEAMKNGFTQADKDNFSFTKTLMAFGYFTSEVGATQVLNYQAVPGGFVGSIPYASVGKAWGSLEFY